MGGALWDILRQRDNGLLMNRRWTEQLVEEAHTFKPPSLERETIWEVWFTCFDNYTRRCLYKSQVAAGEGGYRLDMTNWGSMKIPRRLLP